MFNWRPNKPDMVIIVNEILPYLRIKAERGEIILRLAADIAFYKGRTGGRGKFSLPSEVGVFREKLYQQFQATKNTPVAETECVGSTDSKEEKRQSDLHGDMQSSVETSEPLCGDANAT